MMVIKKMPHPQKKSRCKRAGDEISLEQQDEQDYQECVDKLHCQLEKEHPKRKTVKKLMKAIFAGQWRIQGGAQGARAPPLASEAYN